MLSQVELLETGGEYSNSAYFALDDKALLLSCSSKSPKSHIWTSPHLIGHHSRDRSGPALGPRHDGTIGWIPVLNPTPSFNGYFGNFRFFFLLIIIKETIEKYFVSQFFLVSVKKYKAASRMF